MDVKVVAKDPYDDSPEKHSITTLARELIHEVQDQADKLTGTGVSEAAVLNGANELAKRRLRQMAATVEAVER